MWQCPAADPDYWKGEVFAYVGLPQNLKDLKDRKPLADKNVVGLQVGVSSTKKVCPARFAWLGSVRDDVLEKKK